MLLKPAEAGAGPARRVLPAASTGSSTRATNGYVERRRACSCAASILTIVHRRAWWRWAPASSARALPAGFIPDEDQGIFGVNVQLPPGASLERTSAVLDAGRGDPGQDRGRRLLPDDRRLRRRHQHLPAELRDDLRPPQALGGAARRGAAREGHHGAARSAQFAAHPRGGHLPVQHPDDLGLRRLGGLQLPAPGPERHAERRAARRRRRAQFLDGGAPAARARQPLHLVRPELSRRSRWSSTARRRARSACPINEVFQAMSAALGGAYVNDFNRFGRLFRVYVQAEADYRRKPEDIGEIYVRSKTTNDDDPALDARHHHAQCRAPRSPPASTCCARWRSAASPGARLHLRARRSPRSRTSSRRRCRRRWASPTRRCPTRRRSRRPPGPTFVMAIVFVFLLLAAMYESWRLPWAVLLGSPLVALGAFFGVWLDGLRQQRLRADRPHHADRPRRQERDPDRRVRQGEARGGHAARRRPRSSRRACASGPS